MISCCHFWSPGGAVGELGVIVELVLCVGFADRVWIGQGVQVGKQVEPSWEVFGLPCGLACRAREREQERDSETLTNSIQCLHKKLIKEFSHSLLLSWMETSCRSLPKRRSHSQVFLWCFARLENLYLLLLPWMGSDRLQVTRPPADPVVAGRPRPNLEWKCWF